MTKHGNETERGREGGREGGREVKEKREEEPKRWSVERGRNIEEGKTHMTRNKSA